MDMENARDEIERLISPESENLCYTLEKMRPNVFLGLRFKDGRKEAFPLSHLCRMAFKENEMTLEFGQHRLTIKGCNLGPIYRHLLLQEVSELKQAESPFQEDEQQPVIENITIEMI